MRNFNKPLRYRSKRKNVNKGIYRNSQRYNNMLSQIAISITQYHI
jgi:hypothetical protein